MFLRVIGVANAAIWFGSATLIWFVVEPLFLAPEFLRQVPRWTMGLTIMERWYALQYACAGVALAHLVAEWLYLGRSPRRPALYLVLGLLALTLFGGAVTHPRLAELHLDIFGIRSTVEQREQGQKWFAIWRTTSRVLHGLLWTGLLVFLCDATTPGGIPRISSIAKFRG